jgi:hypothetical protein
MAHEGKVMRNNNQQNGRGDFYAVTTNTDGDVEIMQFDNKAKRDTFVLKFPEYRAVTAKEAYKIADENGIGI